MTFSSPPISSSIPGIVIIGGGGSGVLVAAQLLRQAKGPLHIVMIDRKPPFARGVAFGTECTEHLLNVTAARMSALAEDPDHFFKWLKEREGRSGYPREVVSTDFVSRRIYGEYLYSVLQTARSEALPEVKFEIVEGEAIDITDSSRKPKVMLADERLIEADLVVLALGNLPGEYPIKKSLPFYRSRRYVHVPWRADAIEGIRPEDEILIVGAGLTAVDIILQLEQQGHRGKIHAVSRRGLRPQAHKLVQPYPDFLAGETLPSTVAGVLHRVRTEIRRAAKAGLDWRGVIDALRSHNQAIWLGWTWEQRAQFLRHLRPYWETHRHRFAPEVADKIEALRAEGRVEFYAGRLQSFTETADGVEAVFRRRGTEELKTLHVGKVINCTGPRSDYSKYQHPLFINLLSRGLIDHDPLALGLNATSAGEVFRYRGGPVGWLFTLGAPLKGVLWECTAIPEIRLQARAMAEKLLSLTACEPHPALA